MHSISRPTCPPSTSFTVIVSAMTASLVGQAGPDQRLGSRRRRDRRRAGSDRLSTSSQPQRSHPTRPPTSAVRGWPHWYPVPEFPGGSGLLDKAHVEGTCEINADSYGYVEVDFVR